MFTCYPKYNINLGDKYFDNSISLYFKFLRNDFMKEGNNVITMYYSACDAPNPGGPVDHRQPAENPCVLYHETHT